MNHIFVCAAVKNNRKIVYTTISNSTRVNCFKKITYFQQCYKYWAAKESSVQRPYSRFNSQFFIIYRSLTLDYARARARVCVCVCV